MSTFIYTVHTYAAVSGQGLPIQGLIAFSSAFGHASEQIVLCVQLTGEHIQLPPCRLYGAPPAWSHHLDWTHLIRLCTRVTINLMMGCLVWVLSVQY